jgi:hypothetical protein
MLTKLCRLSNLWLAAFLPIGTVDKVREIQLCGRCGTTEEGIPWEIEINTKPSGNPENPLGCRIYNPSVRLETRMTSPMIGILNLFVKSDR